MVSEVERLVKNKKILVLGLAKTGISVVKHLSKMGALITVNDIKPIEENKEAQDLIEDNARVITGSHPVELLEEDFAFMVKNPGIPYTNPMVVRAKEKGIPIYTDIELVQWFTQAQIIGITGSNGKTTTTSLAHTILKEANELDGQTLLGGNIGIPALDVAVGASDKDRLVLELSSFQLMGVQTFHPHIAAIIDIYPTHLDYHGTLENYVNAKWNITKNQTSSDYLLLNADQEILWRKQDETESTIIPFSLKKALTDGAWYDIDSHCLMWRDECVMRREQLLLPGDHNVQNALVAIAIAKLLGVHNTTIIKVLSQFYGVKHRIQFIREYHKRRFYNDSKATNNEATITALKSFQEPTIWLCGGLDRHNSVEELMPYLSQVKAMIVSGESKEKFKALGKEAGIPVIEQAEWIEDAVETAYRMSEEGDIILFSPASASWDQYPNFEVRGDRFIKAVETLN